MMNRRTSLAESSCKETHEIDCIYFEESQQDMMHGALADVIRASILSSASYS